MSRMCGGEVDGMTWRIELIFLEIVHVKLVKSGFELVTNIVVPSDGGGTFAVFQVKFVVTNTTKAAGVGDSGRKER